MLPGRQSHTACNASRQWATLLAGLIPCIQADRNERHPAVRIAGASAGDSPCAGSCDSSNFLSGVLAVSTEYLCLLEVVQNLSPRACGRIYVSTCPQPFATLFLPLSLMSLIIGISLVAGRWLNHNSSAAEMQRTQHTKRWLPVTRRTHRGRDAASHRIRNANTWDIGPYSCCCNSCWCRLIAPQCQATLTLPIVWSWTVQPTVSFYCRFTISKVTMWPDSVDLGSIISKYYLNSMLWHHERNSEKWKQNKKRNTQLNRWPAC